MVRRRHAPQHVQQPGEAGRLLVAKRGGCRCSRCGGSSSSCQKRHSCCVCREHATAGVGRAAVMGIDAKGCLLRRRSCHNSPLSLTLQAMSGHPLQITAAMAQPTHCPPPSGRQQLHFVTTLSAAPDRRVRAASQWLLLSTAVPADSHCPTVSSHHWQQQQLSQAINRRLPPTQPPPHTRHAAAAGPVASQQRQHPRRSGRHAAACC